MKHNLSITILCCLVLITSTVFCGEITRTQDSGGTTWNLTQHEYLIETSPGFFKKECRHEWLPVELIEVAGDKTVWKEECKFCRETREHTVYWYKCPVCGKIVPTVGHECEPTNKTKD